ncbi:MAG: GNAT family N-acetyltransferase [Planctomycetes bacterium]|nr:GNAT family N-acetyltransferase [Planctomycetota bacterium]
MASPSLTFHEISPRRWPDLVRLFGPNGACGGCWCMWWRVEKGGKTWEAMKANGRSKRTLASLIRRGRVLGILAYAGKEPVGWCTFGPRRADFPRLDRVRAYQRDDLDRVWSIPCFFVARGWRGKGVASALLQAAVAAAKKRGARVLEGYPVTKGLPAAFAYTGSVTMFERRGFERVAGTRRDKPLVRLPVGSNAPA